tara:strand:- start:20 stop:505 length:486 start_codon:yes stop_codon:yes gene_type:complete
MKTLIKILCLSSLCLGQLILSDEQLASMSNHEKQMIFEKNKKNEFIALSYQCLFPPLGYAYINQWNRGLDFLLIEASLYILGLAIILPNYFEEDETKNLLGITALMAAPAIRIYTLIDLSKQTNKYNEQLHNKIFGKKDNNFSFLILPTSNGAYLNLSYKF